MAGHIGMLRGRINLSLPRFIEVFELHEQAAPCGRFDLQALELDRERNQAQKEGAISQAVLQTGFLGKRMHGHGLPENTFQPP
jgi:hypothetical protein